MTYERREEIFSKEALTVADVVDMFDCSKSKAAEMIRDWKIKINVHFHHRPRIDFDGRIHVLDYFEVMNIDPCIEGRYNHKEGTPHELRVTDSAKRSVCH